MHPAYFDTHFATPDPTDDWPAAFAVITAYATTGTSRSAAENDAADRLLEAGLRARGGWLRRLTGYSPITGHAETGWAVELAFEMACDQGERFEQDAIYYVIGDELSVSHCDARRGLVPVGPFRERVNPRECSPHAPSEESMGGVPLTSRGA